MFLPCPCLNLTCSTERAPPSVRSASMPLVNSSITFVSWQAKQTPAPPCAPAEAQLIPFVVSTQHHSSSRAGLDALRGKGARKPRTGGTDPRNRERKFTAAAPPHFRLCNTRICAPLGQPLLTASTNTCCGEIPRAQEAAGAHPELPHELVAWNR